MTSQRGQILYALIARGTVVLTECTTNKGNFAQVTRVLLQKIPSEDSKMSYIYESYVFHYIVEEGITYLCMADESVDRQIAFHCLEAIKSKFRQQYADRAQQLIAYSIDVDFKRVLSQQMDHANNTASRGNEKIAQINETMEQVKTAMYTNIDKVLDRGERIELLVDKSTHLNDHANQFRRRAKTLKNRLWWQNVKLMLILFLIVAGVAYIIAAIACGGFALKEC